MKTIRLAILFLSLLWVGCSEPTTPSATLRIVPTVQGRATALDFEENDCIGLTVIRSSGAYIENQPLAYHGGCFVNASLLWYAGGDRATLRAYFPYSISGITERFTVAADQSAGYEASDLLCAQRTEVSPSSEPVRMTFYHVLARLQLLLTNETTAAVQTIALEGLHATAAMDWTTLTATADTHTPKMSIVPCPTTPSGTYVAILVPQSGTLTVAVTTEKQTFTKNFEADFQSGKSYNLALTLKEEGLSLSVSGDIVDWGDGGNLTPEEEGKEPADDDTEEENDVTLILGSEQYATCVVGSRRWMAENLRTLPDGATVGEDLYYPRNAATNQGDAGLVATLGYLYSYETAQTLCPQGWHLPTAEELALLADAPASFFTAAGMYALQTEGGQYQSSNYLLGTLSTDNTAKCHVLKFTSEGFDSLKTLNSNYGYSVRYVADEKAD